MGKICSFYSPLHGQCGTTATMVAAAFALEKEGFSVVMVHSQSSFADLENMFFTKENKKNTFYDGIGLDGLCYAIKAGELTQTDLARAVLQLGDNLYLLPSAAKRADPEREEILRYIITEKLPLYYDYVFVDTGSVNSAIAEAVRERAEIKLAVVAQNRETLRDFPEATAIFCGNYDKNRKLNLGTLKKRYKKTVFGIPHCSAYADAIEESSVRQFFLLNESLLREETKKRFFQRLHSPNEDTENFFKELRKVRKMVNKKRSEKKRGGPESEVNPNG